MTALAMIIGMLPMALGLGEGGEQNAPLGRAVIGGLVFATVATLIFVPVVFSLVHARDGRKPRRVPHRRASCRPDSASEPAARAAARPAPDRRRRRVAAVVVVVTGIYHARAGNARLQRWHRAQALPTVVMIAAGSRREAGRARAAGPHRGVVACADLCARQRLPEELEVPTSARR